MVMCTCPPGHTGDPFSYCRPVPQTSPPPQQPQYRNPCEPSPCGQNAQCKEANGVAVCSCLAGYHGDPTTGCRPECVTSSECVPSLACINQKCKDPCAGLCGINAQCRVINHNARCNCLPGYEGDPYKSCAIARTDPPKPQNPCQTGTCGPNSECRELNGRAACSCKKGYVGSPPACRPECLLNNDCSARLACIGHKCKDPCKGECGQNADCSVVNHIPNCRCRQGFAGDAFRYCSPIPQTTEAPRQPENPCYPGKCGQNALCRVHNGIGVCSCIPDYYGNPYEACRPECMVHSDCDRSKACESLKCKDPCPGVCGFRAECRVHTHVPTCFCPVGYQGDPYTACSPIPPTTPRPTSPVATDPCYPSPCGVNADCIVKGGDDDDSYGVAVCKCRPGFPKGDPLVACRPECVINDDCSRSTACGGQQKCIDPCPGLCGTNAKCSMVDHKPLCTCNNGFVGDPYRFCSKEIPQEPVNPCFPNKCGPYSECREINGRAACSCKPKYIGSPPNCRPECIVHSDCASHLACVQEKCQDPCRGQCGLNADCSVRNHEPFCRCVSGYIGDPYSRCLPRPPPPPKPSAPVEVDPCYPSPCGANADCTNQNGVAVCKCQPEYYGNPYEGCRPECVLDAHCSLNKNCERNKCMDPCPGRCGSGADCLVVNHITMCSCPPEYTGDPFSYCTPIPKTPPPKQPPTNPCYPDPCGANAQCRDSNGVAICSCLPNYHGEPPNCRPECVSPNECAFDKTCVNQKCVDPCPGVCGQNALCRVVSHNPTCDCISGYTGDPFRRCSLQPVTVPQDNDPCSSNICGPNAICRNNNGRAACSCKPGYQGSPPNCRPECVTNPECPATHACVGQKCKDPCPGVCGTNANCLVQNHSPICKCKSGYRGDPFHFCSPIPATTEAPRIPENPCYPGKCGQNAQCSVHNDIGICKCLPDYYGNPYEACRPECVVHTDCDRSKACERNKCTDPCRGVCGFNAECRAQEHRANCYCREGYIGDPFIACSPKPVTQPPREPVKVDPCYPSPCGPNADCTAKYSDDDDGVAVAVCKCRPGYPNGDPVIGCRPECVTNDDCAQTKACGFEQKCFDPCSNLCGPNAQCKAIQHNPICQCLDGYTGDPYRGCRKEKPQDPVNPCFPNKCGPYSECREINGRAACSCKPNYIGSPPNCRPECVVHSDCASHLACVQKKCQDPCPGKCGLNADCSVRSHEPICRCISGYIGDPYTRCLPRPPPPPKPTSPVEVDPCYPSPCGANADCTNQNGVAVCKCQPEYYGNPYEGCRPECVLDTHCSGDKNCDRNKCMDPCPGRCGSGADCLVVNHVTMCTCPPEYTGDPFSYCTPIPKTPPPKQPPTNPCYPDPCGANAQCREANDVAICSCLPNYHGEPPNCRPECVSPNECAFDKTCVNQKCVDPCPGVCGQNALCRVVSHNPTCDCISGYTGDPFRRCSLRPVPVPQDDDPCSSNICGPNAICRNDDGRAACSCKPGYQGSPPNCRPECVTNSDCATTLACVGQKCKDPCPGQCGPNANCLVRRHNPTCKCLSGYNGDPYRYCTPIPATTEKPREPENPCYPGKCGQNAQCTVHNGIGVCKCLPEYYGNPYEACRPECVVHSDCAGSKACERHKCVDPCPGVCGFRAECRPQNHVPNCYCPEGYQGDPFTVCSPIPITDPPKDPIKVDPCYPSPCGPNADCTVKGGDDDDDYGVAVCKCRPGFPNGDPLVGCRPECVINDDCTQTRACGTQQKCVDPCAGLCGTNAVCKVINHNPICTCQDGYQGNPYGFCSPVPEDKPKQTCYPNPCGPNSECRELNDRAACSCLPDYLGSPPYCRAECTVSSDCPSHLSCKQHKCVDPCIGACGGNAECRVQSHNPFCFCRQGFIGNAYDLCSPVPVTQRPTTPTKVDPCYPSPCGTNAECRERSGVAVCKCLPDFFGNAYVSCKPECLLDDDCSYDKACGKSYKCYDPCQGTCGVDAICKTVNHVPNCYCPEGMVGDAFTQCRLKPADPVPPLEPANPCVPSPCGENANCRLLNGVAMCTCLPGYIGDPLIRCRHECVTDSECTSNKACIGFKCRDPCDGTCGYRAECRVVNHQPRCSCPRGFSGDPFRACYEVPVTNPTVGDPCQPSPCGPNSQCRQQDDKASCSCLPGYQGSPPNCRPECVLNRDCPTDKACRNQKCEDPCPGFCGTDAICTVRSHNPRCSCKPSYTGDAYRYCSPIPKTTPAPREPENPCRPGKCGQNAQCRIHNGIGVCSCLPGYFGNPYDGCRPECETSDDCALSKACEQNKCVDPCPGVCGFRADCQVRSHVPMCYCPAGYEGDPFRACHPIPPPAEPTTPPPKPQPCFPNPCGPNAECKEKNGAAVCTCLPGFPKGDPLSGCRPECVVNEECQHTQACMQQKCADPCRGVCGINARCSVQRHNPICTCESGYRGDPFTVCRPEPEKQPPRQTCYPGRCGPHAECREINGRPVCSCLPSYLGNPPACRPECLVSSDCSRSRACVSEKCVDPCAGVCGVNTECRVQNHAPLCICLPGHTGDPFVACRLKPVPLPPQEPVVGNPCNPSPCGANAQCTPEGTRPRCTCLPEYSGDPYVGCRPECVLDDDCSYNRHCSRRKCRDPCPGMCGLNAECRVINHTPMCSCPLGYTGNGFVACYPVPQTSKPPSPPLVRDPCYPDPCGLYAKCRAVNSAAVCTCLPGYQGDPTVACRPECVVPSECPFDKTCVNEKCIDPCPGTCGPFADCAVISHGPVCTCQPGYIGDPFRGCYPKPEPPPRDDNPCDPNPCGRTDDDDDDDGYINCRVVNGGAFCVPPPQRPKPECTNNDGCPRYLACLNFKCVDPCPGSCGIDARCNVVNHVARCVCQEGTTGNPVRYCRPIPASTPAPRPKDPCSPSPCAENALCRAHNGVAVCQCLPEFFGNPYVSCRPECLSDSDCANTLACMRQKCRDPCPGACGLNAQCSAIGHRPRCTCLPGFQGDPYAPTGCRLVPVTVPVVAEEPRDPCRPNPCGDNARCTRRDTAASCTCLPDYFGDPYAGCKPECLLNADCAPSLACSNYKCRDPCRCGSNAQCQVVNHVPSCSCPTGYTGDPYRFCVLAPKVPKDPCNPSPCGRGAQCEVRNGQAICSCPRGLFGSPFVECRPECTVDSDCSATLACRALHCVDPCRGRCGVGAVCDVFNHRAVCTCPPSYIGDPHVQCRPRPAEPPVVIPRPKPECEVDGDCALTQACISQRCQSPCALYPSVCASNAICRVIRHRQVCSCPDQMTGNPNVLCYELGCRSDSECAPTEACINRECEDPCRYQQCGANAQCRTRNHRARCECLPGTLGSPYTGCRRPECTSDDQCAYTHACRNERCVPVCADACGQLAECRALSHRATCVCPPGYTGDASVACRKIVPVVEEPRVECTTDAECPSRQACMNTRCVDPCAAIEPCGINAQCRVINSLPSRTMICQCLPGFIGDPDVECRAPPTEAPGCSDNSECPVTEACRNRACIDPCRLLNPCGENAICRVTNHAATCQCPSDDDDDDGKWLGNPYTGCYQVDDEPEPECRIDSDCANSQACLNERCVDPCRVASPCGTNADCRTQNHRAYCTCRPGYLGNPFVNCYRPECTRDDDCPLDRACVSENCRDPCATASCGRRAECRVTRHRSQCYCPPGTQGNPLLACVDVGCRSNDDCGDDQRCELGSGACVPVCDAGACAPLADCRGVNHQAQCTCPFGYSGNAYFQCIKDEPRVPKPACVLDTDCPAGLACLGGDCRDPCREAAPCRGGQVCSVQNTAPFRTMVCRCPADMVLDKSGLCVTPVVAEPECRIDTDCADHEHCRRGSCLPVCRPDPCGENAICEPKQHRAVCRCPPGYVQTRYNSCQREPPTVKPPIAQPECLADYQCPFDRACVDQRCQDPCVVRSPCAPSARCEVRNHGPVCSCPPGYVGSPFIRCTPQPEQPPAVGCRSNDDCPASLSCQNTQCRSPCNCGENADCNVINHRAICSCRQGYDGNAQTGCYQVGCRDNSECPSSAACINTQCLDVCAVQNPCALNAICTSRNHVAACTCPEGFEGDAYVRCRAVECRSDSDCALSLACRSQRCVDPCLYQRCGSNAQCRVQQHRAECVCRPGTVGNPLFACRLPEPPIARTCTLDTDCASGLACMSDRCVDPCLEVRPCGQGAQCRVLDTAPYRTMVCQCPPGYEGDAYQGCRQIIVQTPEGCSSNSECAAREACINRRCRDPCNCGDNARCDVTNHRPICTCKPGFEGNPQIACLPVGCRSDSECSYAETCYNGNCVNPCLVSNPCVRNAECYPEAHRAQCRCLPGFEGDGKRRCSPEGCSADSECPMDKACVSRNCVNPCRYDNPCGPGADCYVAAHRAQCRCRPGLVGNPLVRCVDAPRPVCDDDDDCGPGLACVDDRCVEPCAVIGPCDDSARCTVVNTAPMRTMVCRCPADMVPDNAGGCVPIQVSGVVGCASNSDCPQEFACVNGQCRDACDCGPNADCRVVDHRAICSCKAGYSGNPNILCAEVGCTDDSKCAGDEACVNGECVNPCVYRNPCAINAECYGVDHRPLCRCPAGMRGDPFQRCESEGCRSDSECAPTQACRNRQCVDVCQYEARCAPTAECVAVRHQAVCRCPPHLPLGNPHFSCRPRLPPVAAEPECRQDADCGPQLGCINERCQNPCAVMAPCHPSAECRVVDVLPVRSMVCVCRPGFVPERDGVCRPVAVPSPPGCEDDDFCPDDEACFSRQCRSPCNCGSNADCTVLNHRAICSCREGYEGNANIACHAVGCRGNSECPADQACVNSECVNPCLVRNECGINAECYVRDHNSYCRCLPGYEGDPRGRCLIAGCRADDDCPDSQACMNRHCVSPCVHANPCAPRADCRVFRHRAECRCPPGFIGNPLVACVPEPRPECTRDADCGPGLACMDERCADPCRAEEPCGPAVTCRVVDSLPVRSMTCVCPDGYVGGPDRTCLPLTAVTIGCSTADDCGASQACVNAICREACQCGANADCQLVDHSPVCTCLPGYEGNPNIACHEVGCRSNSDCPVTHACVNGQCEPVCDERRSPCGQNAICEAVDHEAQCSCKPGTQGDDDSLCVAVGCEDNSECPPTAACVNQKCVSPCELNPCEPSAECRVVQNQAVCVCPPGYEYTVDDDDDDKKTCTKIVIGCTSDSECPSGTACFDGACENPCDKFNPCAENAECTVVNTEPVRTMSCECLPGYRGNAKEKCEPIPGCPTERGFVVGADDQCLCPPPYAVNMEGECAPCDETLGYRVDEQGNCVCAVERGMVVDKNGNCGCPDGFILVNGICTGAVIPPVLKECESNDDCPNDKYCERTTQTCEDPCKFEPCGANAFCVGIDHEPVCNCIPGHTGDAYQECRRPRTDLPSPNMVVNCMHDGVHVDINVGDPQFNGLMYVKGYSQNPECRKTLGSGTTGQAVDFKVLFNTCGLIHVDGEAQFVLVIQKHPKLVTAKALAYQVRCVYNTGEKTINIGFNVSMLTTAGTIANTGPPPTCTMQICTQDGEEISSAKIGDTLMLKVDVQPQDIYGGFARNCIATTVDENEENEYLVTDENGCATDPSIFGEWAFDQRNNQLKAIFNAFKFPSSNNIKFRCNVRVCFGRCPPVNCAGLDAFGRRRRRRSPITDEQEAVIRQSDSFFPGQLREEIVVQSGPILTFEQKEPTENRFVDPEVDPTVQEAGLGPDEICVSKLGFIIALIITALLALVAVAIAISCWLMAYRRRRKVDGPLPHPPEFPNPLYTTPEPLAEPSPDYQS